MKITVIGAGYVGLVTATCLAEVGHDVMCVEKISQKLEILCRGMSPIYEPGLNELLQKNIDEGRLTFTDDIREGVDFSDTIFLCVGTPQGEDGKADLSQVEEAVREIAKNMKGYKLIVEKSTVPVNTHKRIEETIKRYLNDKNIPFDVASNPEFLREGSAVYDFMNPDRIVVGVNSEKAKSIMEEIYKPFTDKGYPLILTTTTTAELIKYASNSFLAMKISYINMVADLCEKVGADIKEVAEGMGYDKRIGKQFLNAGIGYGGSCFAPDEIVFVKTDKGIELYTFEELFNKAKEENIKNLEILSAEEGEGLKAVKLDFLTIRDYSDTLLEIALSYGRKIKITKDHPVLVLKDGELKTILAEELNIGDEIIFPTLKTAFSSEEVEIDLRENTNLNAINTYYVNGQMSSVVVERNSLETSDKLKIDKEFARFLGYYSSNGFLTEDLKEVVISFNIDELEYLEDLKDILFKLGLEFTTILEGNNHTIKIYSEFLAYLLKNIFIAGENSFNKNIPPQIFISKGDIRKEYLKGLFKGSSTANTTSKKLANGIVLLLQMDGVISNVEEKISDGNVSYSINVNSLENYFLSNSEPKENFAILKVEEITPHEYKGSVYSLETDNFKLISSYGLFIHNCFPKDVKAFIKIAEDLGLDFGLLKETDNINLNRRKQFIKKVEDILWVVKNKNIAIWGLAFKPNTDDIREAPSIDIVNALLQMGANLRLYDPKAMEHFGFLFPETERLKYAYDKYDALKYADALLILTEWDEFKKTDFNKLKRLMRIPIIIDGRNIFEPEELKDKGVEYYPIGRLPIK